MESSKYVLDFGRCNLSDESLSICLSRLPKVTSLNLSYNSITILPACIKECYHLRELHVGNCEQLRLIEEMPPNLEIFFAENCISLTSLSVSKVLNQVFCELDSQTRMIFSPGNEVPKWFHHYNDGNLIEFWVRKEFPALDLCVVIAGWEDGYMEFFEDYLCLRVNDKWTPIPLHVRYDIYDLQMDHMLLFRLGRKVVEDELQGLLLPDQWNRVEVSVEEGTAKSIGIYVYEQENTMHNILFSRPSSLKRTCRDLYNSNSDLVLGCHPLIKKLFPFRGVKNNDTDEWPSLRPPWQEPPLPNVNDGDSNSMALASTGDTINDQDGASMQTSSKKQPSSIAVPIAEENHEEVGLSDNQETFSPPNLETKEVTVNTSMDFEAINKMIQEDPMSAIERLLNGKVSVSSTISGQPEIQIPYFESLQKELKSLLTKFDFSSLISDDFHRSNICFYIEGLEKFESLQPAHRAFIQNFRNFFLNAASNYNKLNEVTNKRIQLKVEREVVSKKLQEARAKDEQMTALISSASLRVKEIVSSNEEIEAQLLKLKHEKEVFELAIIECGKQKEKLRTDCLSWAHQSRDLVVELTKTKKIAQFLEGQVETDKTNFQKLVASIPF
ncbi:hypothetical protein VNO77_33981 [Canavalia gladiata]|uniref:Disease resistance protein RPS4B/Roq1-like leucine-rich repeats domain-containing protein n=1 Tax=Canavalia gladiata TaxID=3824 RepID=A0AAN9KED6_CANGL